MKVWELIAELSKYPAGKDVYCSVSITADAQTTKYVSGQPCLDLGEGVFIIIQSEEEATHAE